MPVATKHSDSSSKRPPVNAMRATSIRVVVDQFRKFPFHSPLELSATKHGPWLMGRYA